MKSNLKQDLENFRKDFASDINILRDRIHALQQKLDTYLVPLLQKHDKEIVSLWSLKERIKQLEAIPSD